MSRQFFRFALIILAAASVACTRPARNDVVADDPPPLVEAIEARVGALPVEEILPGSVRARNQVAIRPEIGARVVEVLVRSGDAVVSGQTLVRLDATEAVERLRQARADVQLAEAAASAAVARSAEIEARVVRMRSLAAEKLVSDQELETLEAQLEVQRASTREAVARVEQARAAAEERRSALAKTEVRAPVAGRLGQRRVEVGMLVDPSDVLFVIGDLDELIIELNLTERMLATVREGQAVEIAAAGAGPALEAALSRISPFLAEDSFTTVGEIDVDNRSGSLRPGMFVDVRIRVGESERAALLPVSAVWEDPETGDLGVFVVQESAGLEELPVDTTDSPAEAREIELRPVSVIAEGRGVAGLEGVDGGEWVVTVGQHLLAAELRAGSEESAASEEGGRSARIRARVRPVSWSRVTGLQNLQNEDLLAEFLDKQRKVARELGAEIPDSEDAVERVLADSGGGDATGAGGE